jgi:hypothetical protein
MPNSSIYTGRGFDAGLAALAAVSAGFVVFAMPEPVFSGFVEATRLPDLIPAAQPPLGETARFAATGAAALLIFAAIWALMAALGRLPAPRAHQTEPEAETPRLRRADAHPDAPDRRPLLARDLGEPLELDRVAEPAVDEPDFAESDLRPLPGFLIPQEDQPEPVAEAEPEAPEFEAEPEAPQEAAAEPLPVAGLAAQVPEEEEEEGEADQSLAQLVNRIEFGLSRKRQALPAVEQPAVEEPSPEQERVGHRLRSAINDLQKIASSGA